MDMPNEKPINKRSLPRSFSQWRDTEEYTITRPPVRKPTLVNDSVDNIIKKYKYEKAEKYDQYSNQNLERNMGEHALFERNVEFTNSAQNFPPNDVNHKNFTNFSEIENRFSLINNDVMKYSHMLNVNNVSKERERRSNNKDSSIEIGLTSNEKLYADKTTYCRPVLSLYNEQFIYKTMERNSKLKRLVKKLAIARQREKANVSWNNFINELKNKHGLSCDDSSQAHQSQHESEQYITPDIIDDYYNTRFSWQQSRLCKNLLQDFYGADNASQPTCTNRHQPRENNNIQHTRTNSLPYHRNSHCYPPSSQGRLIALERERQRIQHLNQLHNCLSNNNFDYEYWIDKDLKNLSYSYLPTSYPTYKKNVRNNNFKNSTIQKDTIFPEFKENIRKNKATNKIDIFSKDVLVQTFETDVKLKENTEDTESSIKNISLINIENKLETLINSINFFINEIKSNRKYKDEIKCTSVTGEMNRSKNKKLNMTRSDIVGSIDMARTERFLCGIKNDISETTVTDCSNALQNPTNIHEMLREIDTFHSKDAPFKNQPCSVQITFEVPTRDCSTEVTKSLSKQDFGDNTDIIEEIRTPEPTPTPIQQMTIAVNTDPFSFLSLLRISTEALKRLLSYMPNIDYYSYLSLLHLPQSTRNVESHYICNICGAAFNKPSKLSDHIQEHNLGKTRDCCVCRHVLDMCKRSTGLFKCQFCGQRFTRAYCCELHQQSCARRLGQRLDVTSSLLLLR